MKIALALTAVLAAGPASAAFKCSARGGAVWHEFRTEHFLLDTDLGSHRAGTLLKQLETLHAMELQALVGEAVEIPGHLRVLAFADAGDFRELAGSRYVAGYFLVAAEFGPIIVIPVEGFEANREVVAHELAHYLSRFLFPLQPLWFAEGLAAFVETVAAPPQENGPVLGSHIIHGQRALNGGVGLMPSGFMGAIAFDARPVPVSELLVWRGGEDETSPGHLHLWSWLLYHYLWNKQGKALTEYQKLLSDGAEPAAAWRAAMPQFDPAKPASLAVLDRALDEYRRSARYAFYTVKAEVTPKHTEAPLSSAQVHLIHLAARMAWPQPEREADELRRAELDEALLEDPGDAGALGWRLTAAGKPDVERLRKALSARPGDWRGWTALGKWLPSGKEKEEAYRKAAALNPENAVTQNNLAWELVTSARAKEALPFANRALDLAPWDAAIMDTLAHVAAGFGKCPEALRLQRRAIGTMEWQGRSADVFKKGLVEMEARCAVPLAAPASAR
jgi:tetratricopeptide (TPR) repeat protein